MLLLCKQLRRVWQRFVHLITSMCFGSSGLPLSGLGYRMYYRSIELQAHKVSTNLVGDD